MIDSSDKARIEEARQELHRIINDREMKESLLLVFANKQDIPGGKPCPSLASIRKEQLANSISPTAMKPQEVTDALKLTQLKDKIWFVVPSCATTGEGLLEGLVRTLLSLHCLMKQLYLPTCTFNWPANESIGMVIQQRQIPTKHGSTKEIDS